MTIKVQLRTLQTGQKTLDRKGTKATKHLNKKSLFTRQNVLKNLETRLWFRA